MPRTTRLLAVLYAAQGTCYLAYFLWRGFFSRISFFRAPPALIFFYQVYLLFFLFASLYFLYMSYGLLRGQRPVKKSMLIISSLSAILWIPPAILSFGNAITYLTNPNIPPDTRAQWVHHLWTGVFFGAVGILNTASIHCVIYHLTRGR